MKGAMTVGEKHHRDLNRHDHDLIHHELETVSFVCRAPRLQSLCRKT
jgi:hypothetical protein